MRAALTNRDPGDEQPEPLFDPASVEPKTCSCGCTAKNLCPIDAALKHGGTAKWADRPRTCLNAYEPSTAEIPY